MKKLIFGATLAVVALIAGPAIAANADEGYQPSQRSARWILPTSWDFNTTPTYQDSQSYTCWVTLVDGECRTAETLDEMEEFGA